MGYVFDSIYVIAEDERELSKAFAVLANRASAEHGLKVALKSAAGVVVEPSAA